MIVQLPPSAFLSMAMDIGGHPRWRKRNEKVNQQDFKRWCGVSPKSCADIWVDIQVDDFKPNPVHLLATLRFLRAYEFEHQLAKTFNQTEKNIRHWLRVYVPKLQALKSLKFSSLQEEAKDDGVIFLLSVDGTHCPIQEPRPFSTKWSSFKLGKKAGVNYEIGLKIDESKLLWVNGPFPAGELNDLSTFQQKGLKDSIPIGKRCIGDGIYTPEYELISTKNDLDPREVAEFKERVLARHESFNSRLKNFQCLVSKFRHSIETNSDDIAKAVNHKAVFEAVCVLVMYEIGNGHPLFDPYP